MKIHMTDNLTPRRAWCQAQARAFFENKSITQRHQLECYIPDMYATEERVLSAEDLKKYTDFTNHERELYMQYAGRFDEAEWDEWLRDAYLESGFTIPIMNIDMPMDAEVHYVDLQNTTNVYRVDIRAFSIKDKDKFGKFYGYVALSDEEYITLLAECLNKSDYTTGDILTHHPDIYLKIMGSFYYMGEEKAVFLTELYEDARKIMETVGDQMPNY
jgi:hypothetical protein